MKKMPAAEFKARCLRVMEEVKRYRTPVVITKKGVPVAKLVPANVADQQEKRRQAVEEIMRWRVGKDRGAKPGSTISELIKAGRRY